MKYTPIAIRLAKFYYTQEGFSHALRVADLALEGFGQTIDTDRLYATAILHDIVEDTSIDFCYLSDQIGKEIADDIYDLSRRPLQTYMDYIRDIAASGSLYAVRVKQADIKDHLGQKETLTESLKERYLKALPLLI